MWRKGWNRQGARPSPRLCCFAANAARRCAPGPGRRRDFLYPKLPTFGVLALNVAALEGGREEAMRPAPGFGAGRNTRSFAHRRRSHQNLSRLSLSLSQPPRRRAPGPPGRRPRGGRPCQAGRAQGGWSPSRIAGWRRGRGKRRGGHAPARAHPLPARSLGRRGLSRPPALTSPPLLSPPLRSSPFVLGRHRAPRPAGRAQGQVRLCGERRGRQLPGGHGEWGGEKKEGGRCRAVFFLFPRRGRRTPSLSHPLLSLSSSPLFRSSASSASSWSKPSRARASLRCWASRSARAWALSFVAAPPPAPARRKQKHEAREGGPGACLSHPPPPLLLFRVPSPNFFLERPTESPLFVLSCARARVRECFCFPAAPARDALGFCKPKNSQKKIKKHFCTSFFSLLEQRRDRPGKGSPLRPPPRRRGCPDRVDGGS